MDSNDQTNKNQRNRNKRTDPAKRSERGYAWICLMTVIIFALILTAAAAPTRRLETQRENEEEMFWRGQQVAVAIKRYRALKGGMFPTDLNDLVRGIDRGGKKIRLLRPSALCDPMTPCADGTNWQPVNPGDPLLKELLDAIIVFPDIPVFTGDFNNPYLLGGASAAKDPRCPDGGVFVDGKCYGAVRHGVYCRDPVTMKSVPCSSLNK